MSVVHTIALVLHFVGLAALLGGFMVQIRSIRKGQGRVVPAMVHGALTQLVTGLVLVGIAEAGTGDVNHVKITIKAVVLIVVMVLVFLNRKRETVAPWVLWSIGGLTFANVAIAAAW